MDNTHDKIAAGLTRGEDGRVRPAWASSGELLEYYDNDWGYRVDDEAGIFERLSLECLQAGLSWLTILRKRDALREAFAGFDPDRVATFTDADLERLLVDDRLIRNRAKLSAIITNARATVNLRADGGLATLVWSFHDPEAEPPATCADIPSSTPASAELAAALKARGFRFVGPVNMYALMQAIGVVNDHVPGTWRHDA